MTTRPEVLLIALGGNALIRGSERGTVEDVDGAALHYGAPGERFLRAVSVAEAAEHIDHGHFATGSMGPEMEAAVRGDAGTQITTAGRK